MPSILYQKLDEATQTLEMKFSKPIDFNKDDLQCSDTNSTAYYIDLGNVEGHCAITSCSSGFIKC